ncbi:MAG: hypothetical protein OXG15_00230 [Gammaproteobacteria bacterium]|nr:hypothetical protein [Gammaproteobacteria bacterium]
MTDRITKKIVENSYVQAREKREKTYEKVLDVLNKLDASDRDVLLTVVGNYGSACFDHGAYYERYNALGGDVTES